MLVNIELSGREYLNNFPPKSKLKDVKKWFENEINITNGTMVSFKYNICHGEKIYKNLTMEEVKNNLFRMKKDKFQLDTLKLYAEIDTINKDNKCNIL